jgi:hypothetical protein
MVIRMKDALKMITKEMDIPRISEELNVFEAWSASSPDKVRKNAEFENFTGGILYLSVKNSSWGQQVNLLKTKIMLEMNSYIGKQLLRDIRIKPATADKSSDAPKAVKILICPVCGVEHRHGSVLCPVCEIQRRGKLRYDTLRLLVNDPKATFAEAKRTVKGIEEVDFKRAKRDLKEMAIDELVIERRSRGRKKIYKT